MDRADTGGEALLYLALIELVVRCDETYSSTARCDEQILNGWVACPKSFISFHSTAEKGIRRRVSRPMIASR